LSPAACNRLITSDQHDPSAKSPCTRTTLRAFVGPAAAARARVDVNEAAAPATRAAEKVRLLINMGLLSLSSVARGPAAGTLPPVGYQTGHQQYRGSEQVRSHCKALQQDLDPNGYQREDQH
jgi:hypothetical protein